VLAGLAPVVDYHSIHLYTGQADHYANVFQAHQAERAVRICEALIERVRLAQRIAHPIHIAFDEWNVWYRTRSHEDRVGGVEERYNVSDMLAVATYLNGFIRHCRSVRLANFAQLVNAIAPVFTNKQGLFLQTIYHPLRLYAEHTQETALDVSVDGPTYDLPPELETEAYGRVHHVSDLGPFALLDATATCDAAAGTLTLAVVNRDRDRSHVATIDLGGAKVSGGAEVSEVSGPDIAAMNSFEHPDVVGVRERRLEQGGGSFDHEFPARSLSVLRMRASLP
jgi:alpha-N-arabinofuranosidase